MVTSRDSQPISTPAPETLCDVSRLTNGIYQAVFHGSTHEVVDQYLAQLEVLFRDNPEHDSTLRLLLDMTENVSMPISHFNQSVRRILQKYPNRVPTRTAIVIKHNALISMANTFMRLMRYDMTVHPALFFKPAERDQAIEWLLRDKPTP